jgi:hypothetical protein
MMKRSCYFRIAACQRWLFVRQAFECAGVEFIEENGGGPGVRLHKSQRPKHSKQKATVRVALEREGISYISALPRLRVIAFNTTNNCGNQR